MDKNINKLKAKSGVDISIIEHSKNVAEVAKYIASNYFNIINDEYITNNDFDIIEKSALLHDIGKATQNFQKLLSLPNEKTKPNKHTHNEIGWAVLCKILKNNSENEIIRNIVLYHHGLYKNSIEKQKTDVGTILKSINVDDFNTIKGLIIELIGRDNIIDDTDKDIFLPNFFYSRKNSGLSFTEAIELNKRYYKIRSCVVIADRVVSKIEETDGDYKKELESILYKKNDLFIEFNKNYDIERFNVQTNISSYNQLTKVVKAPAGFGKTLAGLINGQKFKEKILWIVPRNSVAKSVFKSIINELGNSNMSVELFLTGEIIDRHNTNSDIAFSSDIIVTNIDNFLAPVVKNTQLDIANLLITSAYVVFDEYHELISNSALFPLFKIIMELRHNVFKSNTMLLSATPFSIDKILNLNPDDLIILPNEEKHYYAQHNKKINLINDINNNEDINRINVLNTIKDSQGNYINLNSVKKLVHGSFIDERKDELLTDLMNEYGFLNKENNKKYGLIGTQLIQASLNISSRNLYESVFSPESTLQRIGRLNRWGEYEESNYYFNKLNSKGEITLKSNLYSTSLSNKWYEKLLEFKEDRENINLNNLYELYNEFNEENSNEIEILLKDKLMKGLENLSEIYPRKIKKTDGDVYVVDGNKLRADGSSSVFIMVRDENDKWVGVFQEKLYKTFEETFDETVNTLKLVKNVLQDELGDTPYNLSDYAKNKHALKNLNMETLRNLAKYSNTPYVVFNYRYNNELGLIKE